MSVSMVVGHAYCTGFSCDATSSQMSNVQDALQATLDFDVVHLMIKDKITYTNRVVAKDSKSNETTMNLDLDLMFGRLSRKNLTDHHLPMMSKSVTLHEDLTLNHALDHALHLVFVCSRCFFVCKWIVMWLI